MRDSTELVRIEISDAATLAPNDLMGASWREDESTDESRLVQNKSADGFFKNDAEHLERPSTIAAARCAVKLFTNTMWRVQEI